MKLFSNNYKVVNNILPNPNEVVNFANQLKYLLAVDNPYATGYYSGRRSQAVHAINHEVFNKLCESIIIPHVVRKNIMDVSWRVSMYFARSYKIDKPNNSQIHTDQNCIKAGIIYLQKDIDPDSGTTLYDNNYKKIKECKNKFNRGFFYNPTIKHEPSKFVDDRLALIFFIKDLIVKGREYTLKDLN